MGDEADDTPDRVEGDQPADPNNVMPIRFFAIEVIYLVALLLVPIVYVKGGFKEILPDPIGSIPLSVIWFGALGAVTVSLYGVFFHNRKWDRGYEYWYYVRPLTGGVLGMVAYLIFITLIEASGTQPKNGPTPVYYLVAFVAGYNEDLFRLLLARAGEVLLSGLKSEPGRKG